MAKGRSCDILIRNAGILDGSGAASEIMDVALRGDRICDVGPSLELDASTFVDGEGLVLTPGFIDVHAHDDTSVIRTQPCCPSFRKALQL